MEGFTELTRHELLASCTLPLALCLGSGAWAQDLQNRPIPAPPPSAAETPKDADKVQFTADTLEYENDSDTVIASGDVRMYRAGDRLRADKVVWNRTSGKVTATGNIAITNPQGDIAYGDSIDLTDSLKDGMIENMLVVLDEGGRLAAQHGTRSESGVVTLRDAAYTPCDVTKSSGCPKEPTWKITAVKIVYDPAIKRIKYSGAHFDLFGVSVPLPTFSHPVGDGSDSGFLAPDIRYNG
ncbi:hypothetical protein BH09PSE4_BH09PSE4_21730 [soil metagenome]